MESFHLGTVDFGLMPFFRRRDGFGIGLAEELPEEALFRAHEGSLFKLDDLHKSVSVVWDG